MVVERARFAVVVAPHLGEERIAREHLALVGGAEFEELEFLVVEGERLSAVDDGHVVEVHLELAHLEDGGLDGAPKRRVDARHELQNAEGLCDVVVRARIEAAHFVRLLGERREHDGAHFGVMRLDLFQDLHAVPVREHDVEEHDVGRLPLHRLPKFLHRREVLAGNAA